ncbi:MAG: hypothetical protein KVP17_004001 [Porospora cf. gigantea B]|uniref:uncharacterized protein n=1 Tax=Porospora cf. gigantea B TaxID=2853592 RepID=UPI0035719304|nr:MAG: hypothetical protein KVP17_004001 [Porospora cf. gigantea B]
MQGRKIAPMDIHLQLHHQPSHGLPPSRTASRALAGSPLIRALESPQTVPMMSPLLSPAAEPRKSPYFSPRYLVPNKRVVSSERLLKPAGSDALGPFMNSTQLASAFSVSQSGSLAPSMPSVVSKVWRAAGDLSENVACSESEIVLVAADSVVVVCPHKSLGVRVESVEADPPTVLSELSRDVVLTLEFLGESLNIPLEKSGCNRSIQRCLFPLLHRPIGSSAVLRLTLVARKQSEKNRRSSKEKTLATGIAHIASFIHRGYMSVSGQLQFDSELDDTSFTAQISLELGDEPCEVARMIHREPLLIPASACRWVRSIVCQVYGLDCCKPFGPCPVTRISLGDQQVMKPVMSLRPRPGKGIAAEKFEVQYFNVVRMPYNRDQFLRWDNVMIQNRFNVSGEGNVEGICHLEFEALLKTRDTCFAGPLPLFYNNLKVGTITVLLQFSEVEVMSVSSELLPFDFPVGVPSAARTDSTTGSANHGEKPNAFRM